MIHFSETLPTTDRWKVSRVINELCPPHWTSVRLGDVATVQNGFPFESKFFNETRGFPLIRIRDVGVADTKTCYDGPVDPAFIVQPGDIVVGMDGEFRCARWRGRPALLNQRVCRITRSSEQVDEDYFFLLLQTYLSAVEAVTSSVTVRHLSSRTVEDLELALPPKSEQQRIAKQYAVLLAKTESTRIAVDEAISLLENVRRSVLAAAFRGDLTRDWRARNGGEEFAADRSSSIPQNWQSVSLQNVVREAKTGLVRSAAEQGTEGVPYIRMQHYDLSGQWNAADLTRVRVTEREMRDYALEPGDVLFNTRNSYELVGKVAIWQHESGTHVFNNNLMRLRFTSDVDSPFMGLQMQSPGFRAGLEECKSATTSVCALYGRDLFRQRILLPPIAEQRLIAERVARVLARMERVQSTYRSLTSQLSELNAGILAKAFRGELVPQDPEDEPASVLLERIRAERERDGAGKPARRGRRAKAAR